ncbi:MAG: AAA family ATPase [Chloroflexota bacterium]|nr:AAA family ATPase [Chloroflexota bacterium]
MENGMEKYEVSVGRLRWTYDPTEVGFARTDDLTPLEEFIGQDRAISAVKFGLEMNRPGYNIYVAGLTGTGKTSVVKSYIQRLIKEREEKEGQFKPDDWCYVYNFSDTDRPQVVRLPQGRGKTFGTQMATLLQQLQERLGKVFSSQEYEAEKKKIVDEGQARQREVVEQLSSEAQSQGILFQITPMGPILVPMTPEGEAMSQTQYLSLDEKVRKELDEKREKLWKQMESSFDIVRESEKNAQEKLQELDRNIGERSIRRLFRDLLDDYRQFDDIDQYLKGLESFALDNLDLFKQQEAPTQLPPVVPGAQMLANRDPFIPFRVNLFVDNSDTVGPPVIIESNPTYVNLFGKKESRFFFGAYLSDHTMLKPGSFSLANGGYLLLNPRDVLTKVGVWEALKRAIRNKEVRIEEPLDQFGLFAPVGMRPQPMPVDVKVILIGDNYVYGLLSEYDEDFWELFRVKAEFDFEVDRTPENMEAYTCFITRCCEEEGLRHFDPSGVAKVLEFAARAVADQDKLSSRFGQIKEVLVEADYWTGKDGDSLIAAEHVQKALDEKIYRHNLLDNRIRGLILDGTLMIDADGEAVGQVNGLSVYALGDVMFGRPSRITAKTFMGRGGVVNIERESQLSGRIHDKGVLILSGYLGSKYAQERPLSLSASLCFEQSYEGVDGDSASSTELYAVLSSLSGVPLKQSIAVTGSVNQMGEIQPIGGVNHKIESFFRVCKARGLTGYQGVMIPGKNLRNLMLQEEVVDAVAQGQFHIYAVKTIDEGIEVLTGVQAGERGDDGSYPEGTVNHLVDKRLREMAEGLKSFGAETEKK